MDHDDHGTLKKVAQAASIAIVVYYVLGLIYRFPKCYIVFCGLTLFQMWHDGIHDGTGDIIVEAIFLFICWALANITGRWGIREGIAAGFTLLFFTLVFWDVLPTLHHHHGAVVASVVVDQHEIDSAERMDVSIETYRLGKAHVGDALLQCFGVPSLPYTSWRVDADKIITLTHQLSRSCKYNIATKRFQVYDLSR
jgi:hypothetical protein